MKPVWKRPAGVVGGQTLSLDDVENIKLRAPEVRDMVAIFNDQYGVSLARVETA